MLVLLPGVLASKMHVPQLMRFLTVLFENTNANVPQKPLLVRTFQMQIDIYILRFVFDRRSDERWGVRQL